MNLDALSAFVLVAEHGGITQASRVSGRPKASLSRKVVELEASLGVRLFERGSRSVHLTEDGELLFKRASGPLDEIRGITELLHEGRAEPRGRLRISVPVVFGQMLLGRLAAGFTIAYPDVKLEVTMEDRAVDLVGEGYDVVVRLNPSPDSNLVGRCFALDQLLIVSPPSLIAPPGKSDDEEFVLPVVLRSSMRNDLPWNIPGPNGPVVHTRTVLELPTFPMVRDAIITGLGAAKLPRILVLEDIAAGRLVSWGPTSARPAELWALYSSSRLPSAKVKAFLRFITAAFPEEWL